MPIAARLVGAPIATARSNNAAAASSAPSASAIGPISVGDRRRVVGERVTQHHRVHVAVVEVEHATEHVTGLVVQGRAAGRERDTCQVGAVQHFGAAVEVVRSRAHRRQTAA